MGVHRGERGGRRECSGCIVSVGHRNGCEGHSGRRAMDMMHIERVVGVRDGSRRHAGG